MKKNNTASMGISLCVGLLFLCVGLYPLYQLLTFHGIVGEAGLALWIESEFLAPVVFVGSIFSSWGLHRLFRIFFVPAYAFIFALIFCFMTAMSIMPAVSIYTNTLQQLYLLRINPHVQIENQIFNHPMFSFDVVLNNNTNTTYSLQGSGVSWGPETNSSYGAIRGMNEKNTTDIFAAHQLLPGFNRIHIDSKMLTNNSDYRYNEIMNNISNTFAFYVILKINDASTNKQVVYKTYRIPINPSIATQIRRVY